MKTAGTDTNQGFTGHRADMARLQKIVTWAKKVKYGISWYQFIKFWVR